jgi:hypothetical protein
MGFLKKILAVSLMVFFCGPISAFAERIVLKSGQTIEGAVVEKGARSIKLNVKGVIAICELKDIYTIDGLRVIDGQYPQPTDDSAKQPAAKVPVKPGVAFQDEEYGIKLVFPSGWFVVSGKEKREIAVKDIDARISSGSSSKDPKGNKCPMLNTEEGRAKMADMAKDFGLRLIPIVSAYPVKPDNADKAAVPSITFNINKDPDDPARQAERVKLNLQMTVYVMKGTFIEPVSEAVINGTNCVRVTYEYARENRSYVVSACYFTLTGKDCALVLTCFKHEFAGLQPDFENTINSFEYR